MNRLMCMTDVHYISTGLPKNQAKICSFICHWIAQWRNRLSLRTISNNSKNFQKLECPFLTKGIDVKSAVTFDKLPLVAELKLIMPELFFSHFPFQLYHNFDRLCIHTFSFMHIAREYNRESIL